MLHRVAHPLRHLVEKYCRIKAGVYANMNRGKYPHAGGVQLKQEDKNMNKRLVVVIPVFNESEAIYNNFGVIYNTLKSDGLIAEFLLIDDGSKDDTWLYVDKIRNQYSEVSAIRFARNFGKELALMAGVEQFDADYYCFMDSDLQHPPKYIKTMFEALQTSGVNIVEGVKASRGKESPIYHWFATTFYKTLKWITKLEMNNSSDFKIMDREVIDTIRRFHEHKVFFRGIVDWVGFKRTTIPFEVAERVHGNSKFSPLRLMLLALNAIVSYTSKPLYVTVFMGLFFLVFAVFLALQTLYNYLIGTAVSGFSTVILLLLTIGAMLMLSIGIIGVYIARIYDEIKGRPRYILAERHIK